MACSTCITTQGFVQNCEVKVPGGNNYTFYLIPRCKVVSFDDPNTDGIIDDIILNDPLLDVFYKVEANNNSVTCTEDVTLPVGFITQTLAFTISNIASDPDTEVGAQLATDFARDIVNNVGGLLVIVKDRAGINRIYGYQNGLDVTVGQKVSGAVITDIAGNTLTLSGGEPTWAPTVSAAYVNSIPL